MKNLFVLAVTGSVFCTAFAQETAQNDFWNFDTAYVNPVTSVRSSMSTTVVTEVASSSVWDDMAEAFSTFVRGLSVRFW